MDILIYKDGISNNSLKEVLNKKNILYDIDIKKSKYNYIIKPPSVLKEEVLSKVKGKVICDIEFIYMLYKPIIFSVTGTSGKTTTCLLLNNILKRKYDVVLQVILEFLLQVYMKIIVKFIYLKCLRLNLIVQYLLNLK